MARDVLGLEVLDKRVKPSVLGNDVEGCVRLLGREPADIIGDVEVEGIAARALDVDVFGSVWSKSLEFFGEREGILVW
jgi:hypothetical protein